MNFYKRMITETWNARFKALADIDDKLADECNQELKNYREMQLAVETK